MHGDEDLRLGYADTRPHLTDTEWAEWLALAHQLRTGFKIPRKPMKVETVGGMIASYAHVRAPRISVLVTAGSTGDIKARIPMGHYTRTVDCHGPAEDASGRPIFEHPGEIDIWAYRAIQRKRRALDDLNERRAWGKGWTPPQKHIPLFGENRFRPFSTAPYFEDRVGFIAWPEQNATRWNDYVLGERVDIGTSAASSHTTNQRSA